MFSANGQSPIIAQVAKRLAEYSRLRTELPTKNNMSYRSVSQTDSNLKNEKTTIYKLYIADGFTLRNDKKNKWFMTIDNKICEMIKTTFSGKCINLICRSVSR